MENRAESLRVLSELDKARYRANGGLNIYYRPEVADMKKAIALATMAEKEALYF